MRGDRRRRLAARRRRIQRPPIASRRSLGKHGSRPQQKVLVAITTGAPPSSERARNLLHEWASKFVEDKSCSTRIRTRKSSPNGKSAVYKPRFTAGTIVQGFQNDIAAEILFKTGYRGD